MAISLEYKSAIDYVDEIVLQNQYDVVQYKTALHKTHRL